MSITLTAENGRTLRLANVERDGGGEITSYEATLTMPGGSISTVVHEYGTGLPRFFAELAESWKGFDDTKSFRSLEGQLRIEARHDGRGTVYCEVYLQQPWPPEWQVSAVLDFGAGAHMETAADEVGQLLG